MYSLQPFRRQLFIIGPDSLPKRYIIAPHTTNDDPAASRAFGQPISNSNAAMELLKSVNLLQYFDLAGLAEALQRSTKVSINSYRGTKNSTSLELVTATSSQPCPHSGIGSTVAVTSRIVDLCKRMLFWRVWLETSLSFRARRVMYSSWWKVPVDMEDASGSSRSQPDQAS